MCACVLSAPRPFVEQVAKYQAPANTVRKLVESYLLHYAYDRTLSKLQGCAAGANGGATGVAPGGGVHGSVPSVARTNGCHAHDPVEVAEKGCEKEGGVRCEGKAGEEVMDDLVEETIDNGIGSTKRGRRRSNSDERMQKHERNGDEAERRGDKRVDECVAADEIGLLEMSACGNSADAERRMAETLDLRRALRACVLCGDIDGALRLCEESCSGMLARHSRAHFLLLCQVKLSNRRGRDV